MKNKISFLLLLMCCVVHAQHMHVKQFNLTTFNADKRVSSELLNSKSSTVAKQHPEFGVLPYNSQCATCVELIDKRTIDSRLFIDPKNEGHTYSQQSFFPLHYKKFEGDIWRSIDSRLRPTANGIYAANNQPVPTKCNLNTKSTSLNEKGFEFEFNKNLSLYFFDDNTVYTQKQTGSYADYTIGEEGLRVKNIWSGIDMEQIFTVGEIKSNFIISAPLQLPLTKGWMVIEDHFTLPENITMVEEEHGTHLPEGYYRGDYLLKNEKGETLITYSKPVYIDSKVFGMHGIYNLLRTGNDYTLQMLIPVEWLAKSDNTYPLMIDPSVYGATKIGDFVSTGNPSASMAFTSMALGSCDYHMSVTIPGMSLLTNAVVDVEYALTYDNTCGAPPFPPPFCTFSQVSMEVVCDSCHTTTGALSCNPALPPYTGTCTTDSNLVAGANGILVNSFVPNYLSCLSPQCSPYIISFTLKNRDSICGDVCGYLCARGNMWRMTVEANQDTVPSNPLNITVSNDTLFCSQTTGIQWYMNNQLLPGDTNEYIIVTQPANYSVQPTTGSFSPCYYASISFVCAAQFVILNPDSFPFLPGLDSGYYYGVNNSVGGIQNYLWDFGDGATSTDPYPTHTYAQPGHYLVCLTVSNFLCTNTHCDSSFYVFKTEGGLMTKLIIQSPNGITNLNNEEGIKLYPNPANNELNIITGGVPIEEVKIFSADGRLVKNIKQAFTHIDISQLAKGAYIAEVRINNTVKKIRWVKM